MKIENKNKGIDLLTKQILMSALNLAFNQPRNLVQKKLFWTRIFWLFFIFIQIKFLNFFIKIQFCNFKCYHLIFDYVIIRFFELVFYLRLKLQNRGFTEIKILKNMQKKIISYFFTSLSLAIKQEKRLLVLSRKIFGFWIIKFSMMKKRFKMPNKKPISFSNSKQCHIFEIQSMM